MRSAEVEAWLLQVVERAQASKSIEDSRVEAKGTKWPEDIARTARQLGAHANAARGDQILWIIGLDEKTGTVGAVDRTELSTWYPQIQARFDGDIAPGLDQSLVVPIGTESVVALLFTADRAPYVVKAPDPGASIDREVPWREGNRTRTATREDLLRMLVPAARLPTVSIHKGSLDLYRQDPNTLEWRLVLDLYIVPRVPERVVIPYHDCWAKVEQGSSELWRPKMEPRFVHPAGMQPTYAPEATVLVRWSPSGLIVDGPGTAGYAFTQQVHAASYNESDPMDATMHARLAGEEQWFDVSTVLRSAPATNARSLAFWQIVEQPPWER